MLSLMKNQVSEDVFQRACETVKNGVTTGDQTAYQYAVDTVLMLWEEQKSSLHFLDKEKNEPRQLSLNLGRSMNPSSEEIREIELRYAWKETERRRKANGHSFGLVYTPLTFDEYLRYNNIDGDQYRKKPIDRLEYYLRTSKYNNNVRAK